MPRPDYRGARGANAGDDFHELWVLRQSLALLDHDSSLVAVAVEGLHPEDEAGTRVDVWDGVDSTLYFGGDRASSADRVVIQQFKYSSADPQKAWTVARLTHATNKKGDNSVIARLAKPFAELASRRHDLVKSGAISVSLVSNQPVDELVIAALSSGGSTLELEEARRALEASSGLSGPEFVAFAKALDLSGCGSGSRFQLEDRVLAAVASMKESDARVELDYLMRFVRRAMMPEAKGELITRQSLFAALGFSDAAALFPCPPSVRRVERPIPRDIAQQIAARLESGEQYLCLHGEGGCGKTTVLQEVEGLLPSGSVMELYDCYGEGRYLDSDAYRHRKQDAFLQLSNDLARILRTPYLLTRSPDADYPRAFKRRLEMAAAVASSQGARAMVVVAVDAVDNAITAAASCSPPEQSFVHEFATLGDLPQNVRLLITARSGRLDSLGLPRRFALVPMNGFTREETTEFVRRRWSGAPDDWIEDFYDLSSGNPRVESYAMNLAANDPSQALEYLRPHGKDLEAVFKELLAQAMRKAGEERSLKVFCSGLIALPRPVPLSELSAVTDLDEPYTRDLCADLAPGVRVTGGGVGFADEDFEHFVRTEAADQLAPIQARVASRMMDRHRTDAYAATHVAAALLAANRGGEVLSLIESEPTPAAIRDPVLRREAHLQRLRIAMKVCREAGNTVDAALTILAGAEAMKTDFAIRQLLIGNPDLAAEFARDTAARTVLRESREIANHGRLLLQLMAVDARAGNAVSVRETDRQLSAWFGRRAAEKDGSHWTIEARDVAADLEASLRTQGPKHAVERLLQWKPRALVMRAAIELVSDLLAAGDAALAEQWVAEVRANSLWDPFLLLPLALAEAKADVASVEAGLGRLQRKGWITLDGLRSEWDHEDPSAAFLEAVVSACEVMVANGCEPARVTPFLEPFAAPAARKVGRLSAAHTVTIDLSLRALALLERIAGRRLSLEKYLVVDPPLPAGTPDAEERRRAAGRDENKRELEELLGPLVELYDARAQALLGVVAPAGVDGPLGSAAQRIGREEYRYSRTPSGGTLLHRAAVSVSRLMAIRGVDRGVLLERAWGMLRSRSEWVGEREARLLREFAVDPSTHGRIVHLALAGARAVRAERVSAQEKSRSFVVLSRLLVHISRSESRALFNEAIEVAVEVDESAIHEVAVFAPFAARGVSAMDQARRRRTAQDVAVVASDAGVRLAGNDHFPWDRAAGALTTLDVPFALAVVARWEDAGVVRRDDTLPTVILTALESNELSIPQSAALLCMLDRADEGLVERVAQEASAFDSATQDASALEEVARDELLRFGRGERARVAAAVQRLIGGRAPGKWVRELLNADAFQRARRRTSAAGGVEGSAVTSNGFGVLQELQKQKRRYTVPSEIEGSVAEVLAAAEASKAFVSARAVLDVIGEQVASGDRALHLEALSGCDSEDIGHMEAAGAIASLLERWDESAAVDAWCHTRLLDVIVDRMPGFSRYMAFGESSLPTLLARTSSSPEQVRRALLAAVERHVDELDAPTVYSLVALAGTFFEPHDAADLVSRYGERLVRRIRPDERDVWDLADIPSTATASCARLLFAFMSDVEVGVRWRAAHAVRRLARLGDGGAIDALVGVYARKSEPTYRNPGAPFYWLAARLWLLIALDRVASERPTAVARHGLLLLGVAVDQELPHVLLRAFAKTAVRTLVTRRALRLTPPQRRKLEQANSSRLSTRKRSVQGVVFDENRPGAGATRRFHFDWVDTLPYWYSGAARLFASVTGREFLDAAERWIVDAWGIVDESWRWDDEKRRSRVSGKAYASMDHSHGSRPNFERFHTYLEWHAMFCAVGELLKTRALARPEHGEDGFATWLKRDALSSPPLWLADLRGPKPLYEPLWLDAVADVAQWVNGVADADFLAELGLSDQDGNLVVGSQHRTRPSGLDGTARVESALVSPYTASALVRALQTVEDSWDYRIPSEGDDAQIHAGPYALEGWMMAGEGDTGIDERDPFRHGVRTFERRPGKKVTTALGLKFVFGDPPVWVRRRDGRVALTYEAWADGPDEEDERRTRSGSSGWRLLMDRQELAAFLAETKMDLCVEVEIVRRKRGYGSYSQRDEEEAEEARFDKVIVLRRDGSIEGAEGRLGTWATPRKRARHGAGSRHAGSLDGTPPRRTDRRGKKRANRR